MKNFNTNLEDTMDLEKISKPQAKKEYLEGKVIYVKMSSNIWIAINERYDGDFPDFNLGIEYFKEIEYIINDDIIICTRHKNIVDYFHSKGIYGKVLEVVRPDDIIGKTIYGSNLPLHIVSFAKEAYIINIQNTTGKEFDEMTVEDIESTYHQIRRYQVMSEPVRL